MAIIIFLIILGVLVLVHEFGHYIVAKAFSMRVDEFGIGFPPRALTLGKKKETRFTLNWIPFGGFVKIHGENPAVPVHEHIHESFTGKPVYAKAAVLIAGVVFNILLAWLLFSIAFFIGLPTARDAAPANVTVHNPSLLVVDVAPQSPAEASGLQPGDHITAVSGSDFHYDQTTELSFTETLDGYRGGPLEVSFRRGADELQAVVLPTEGTLGIGFVEAGLARASGVHAFIAGAVYTATLTADITNAIIGLIGDAVSGAASLDALTGPVGIVGIVGDAAAVGFVQLLSLTAIISINLAIINLLPIPALDGGRLLFVLIEWVTRLKTSPKVFQWANAIGFLLLILLMIIVTINDITLLL